MKKTRVQALTESMKISNDQLVQFLDEIIDNEFCFEICLNIKYESKQGLDFFLEYCYKRLHKDGIGSVSFSLTEKLERFRRRFASFSLLNSQDEFKYEEWSLFRSTPMSEIISTYFIKDCHDDAILLWRRHCGGIFY